MRVTTLQSNELYLCSKIKERKQHISETSSSSEGLPPPPAYSLDLYVPLLDPTLTADDKVPHPIGGYTQVEVPIFNCPLPCHTCEFLKQAPTLYS